MPCSLALILLSLTPVFPNAEPRFQAPLRTVLVVVRDVRTGEPIRAAPVKWLGSTAEAHTDENGQALLVDDTDEREMRIWTAPDFYTVDVRTMRWMQGWNAVELWVEPVYAGVSPIFPAASGGTHEFKSNAANVEVRVRPGTFRRDVALAFAWFPKWSMEVEEGCELPLLLGQLCVIDERGAVLDIPAAHPLRSIVSVKFQEGASEAGFATIASQLDPTTNHRKWCSAMTVHDGAKAQVECEIDVGNTGRIPLYVSHHVRDPLAAHLPTITVDVERTECVPIARRSISCGQFGAETRLTRDDPSVVFIDPDLGHELARALPGAPRIALGLVEARVGVEMSMTIDAELSAKSIAKFPIVMTEKVKAVSRCFSGTAESMLVRAVYSVKVDGKRIGRITKPIATYIRRSLVHDSSCGEGCATPVEPPTDAWSPCP